MNKHKKAAMKAFESGKIRIGETHFHSADEHIQIAIAQALLYIGDQLEQLVTK